MSEEKKVYPSQKQKQVSFRLTEDELAKVQLLATRANMTLAEYAKHATLRMKVQAAAAPPEMMKDIFGELGHIGGNLNQLARRANEGGDAPTVAEVSELTKAVYAIWDCIAEGKKLPKREGVMDTGAKVVPEVAQTAEATEQPEETKPTVCELCGEPLKEWSRDYGTFLSCPNHHSKGDGHTIIRIR